MFHELHDYNAKKSKDYYEVFIEVDKTATALNNSIIVGAIYRPPNNELHKFNNQLNEVMSKLSSDNKIVYIMGDFNVNLPNSDSPIASSEFLDIMYSKSFLPHITKPTRVTSSTATLIS